MWLRFVSEYCKGIDYVFKIDDDVVIDIYKVMSTIYERKKNSSHSDDVRTISGSCYKESYVVRNKTSKWYTLEEGKNASNLKASKDFFNKIAICSLFQDKKITLLNLKHF